MRDLAMRLLDYAESIRADGMPHVANDVQDAAVEIGRLRRIIMQKNIALEVFADPKMWAQWGRFVNVWNGRDIYEDPREFARREMMRDE